MGGIAQSIRWRVLGIMLLIALTFVAINAVAVQLRSLPEKTEVVEYVVELGYPDANLISYTRDIGLFGSGVTGQFEWNGQVRVVWMSRVLNIGPIFILSELPRRQLNNDDWL